MMKHFNLSSLQSRLIAIVLVSVGCIWLIVLLIAWRDARYEVDEILDSHLAQSAALLVIQQSIDIGEEEHHFDTPLLHHYAPRVMFQVFHEGHLNTRSATAPTEPMLSLSGLKSGFSTVTIGEKDWRVFSVLRPENDIQVLVAEEISSREDILRAVLRSMTVPLGLALPLLGITIWWSIRQGLVPLRNLSEILKKRGASELDVIELKETPREIQLVVNSLNELFIRTRNLLESEQRFTSDAAHELRTPIAAIRMQAQVAMNSAEEVQMKALQNTIAGCDRATHLVDQLLTLARLENDAQISHEPLNLVSLVQSVLSDITVRALHKNQVLEFNVLIEEQILVEGNVTLLSVLVRNLVDNAIRYSPNSSTVVVRLVRNQSEICLAVEDSGPGLEEAQHLNLGKRFFRVLGSGEEGSGLGWSICRRIVSLHHARITTSRSELLGGFRVDVIFELNGFNELH